MAEHAEDHHHHAKPEKPNASTVMGFGLFAALAGLLIGFVGAIRGDEWMLQAGLVLAVVAVVIGLVGVANAKRTGGTTRGFAVVLFASALAAALWAVVAPQIG
jgi:hypothetical protein